MGKYRKKPVVIDAIQWNGDNYKDIKAFVVGDLYINALDHSELTIPTLEGNMTARTNDWIIRGVKGEFYPCKPDIFAATYESAERDLSD